MNKWNFDSKRWSKDVRDSRVALGYSVRELAFKTGIQTTTLHRIITGKREPYMTEFIHICAFLNLEAVEYFDVDEIQMRMRL